MQSSKLAASEEKTTPLTKENIQCFYQVITNLIEARLGYISDTAELIRKHYLAHVKNTLNESPDSFHKTNSIKSLINILISKKVFDGKLDLAILEAIKNDLDAKGKILAQLVDESYHEEFINDLENTQATEAPPTEHFIPVPVHSGIALHELKNDGNPTYQILVRAKELATEAIPLDKERNYPAVIEKLTELVTSMQNIFAYLSDREKSFLFHYTKELAKGYFAMSMSFSENQKNYPTAIENITTAISITEKLTHHGVETKQELETYYTELAHTLAIYGIECRNLKKFDVAYDCFNKAIAAIQAFAPTPTETDKANIALMQHHLAMTKYYEAISSSKNNNRMLAIKQIIEAINILKPIIDIRPNAQLTLNEYRVMLAHIRELQADHLIELGEAECLQLKEAKGEDADKACLNVLVAYKAVIDFLLPIKNKMRGSAEWRLDICQRMLKATLDKYKKSHPSTDQPPTGGVYKETTILISKLKNSLFHHAENRESKPEKEDKPTKDLSASPK